MFYFKMGLHRLCLKICVFSLQSHLLISETFRVSSKIYLYKIFQFSIGRRRVNCSKFICSKKLLDTKISTARHCSSRCQKNGNCSKIKKRVISSRFKFLTKMINCSNCNCSTKTLKNVNCSNLEKLKVWNMYGISVKKS